MSELGWLLFRHIADLLLLYRRLTLGFFDAWNLWICPSVTIQSSHVPMRRIYLWILQCGSYPKLFARKILEKQCQPIKAFIACKAYKYLQRSVYHGCEGIPWADLTEKKGWILLSEQSHCFYFVVWVSIHNFFYGNASAKRKEGRKGMEKEA